MTDIRRTSASAFVAVLLVTVPLSTPVRSESRVPEGVVDMLRQAAASPDPKLLETTMKIAIGAFPRDERAIRTAVASIRGDQATSRLRAQQEAARSLLAGWKGSVEAGASMTTGEGEDRNFALGLGLRKETVKWRHVIDASADFQRSGGRTARERFSFAYNPSYFFTPRLYAAAFSGWERDRRAGYAQRFTQTLGFGRKMLDDDRAALEIEAGPGLRQTRLLRSAYAPPDDDHSFVFRAAARFRYQIAETFDFTQTALSLIGGSNRTLETATALTARLDRDLSSRFSFTVRNESDPRPGRRPTATFSRVTLVYGF